MKIPIVSPNTSKQAACATLRQSIADWGYTSVENNETKPWGAYYRLSADEAERFVEEFFPGLSYDEACLGDPDVKLTPKILLVVPHKRLSWQYHHRRAERWRFLTRGFYHKSDSDEQGDLYEAKQSASVQFAAGERHRLCSQDEYVIVAEIWQHVVPGQPSDEEDIVHLADDFQRG